MQNTYPMQHSFIPSNVVPVVPMAAISGVAPPNHTTCAPCPLPPSWTSQRESSASSATLPPAVFSSINTSFCPQNTSCAGSDTTCMFVHPVAPMNNGYHPTHMVPCVPISSTAIEIMLAPMVNTAQPSCARQEAVDALLQPTPSQYFAPASQSLPDVCQSLPDASQSLPNASQSLPTASQSLPTAGQSLPTASQSLPTAASAGDQSGPVSITLLLSSLLNESADHRVRARIQKLSSSKGLALAKHIVQDKGLMWQMMTVERGAVLAALVEKLQDEAGDIVQFVLSNLRPLGATKGGCLAVPRLLQHVTSAERTLALEALLSDPESATHRYLNYVLQYYIDGGCSPNGLGTEGFPVQPTGPEVCAKLVHGPLSNSQTLLRWSSSRHGSAVVDRVIRHSAAVDLRVLLETMFGDKWLVRKMGNHEFGHYNLKTGFDALLTGQLKDAGDQEVLLRKYYRVVEAQLKSSRYSRWVLRKVKEALAPTNNVDNLSSSTGS